MGMLNHFPLLRRPHQHFLAFKGQLGGFSLDQGPRINRVLQHLANTAAGPLIGCSSAAGLFPAVHAGGWDALLVQQPGNLPRGFPLRRHLKHLPHHTCRLVIHHQMVFVFRVLLIAVGRMVSDILPLFHL